MRTARRAPPAPDPIRIDWYGTDEPRWPVRAGRAPAEASDRARRVLAGAILASLVAAVIGVVAFDRAAAPDRAAGPLAVPAGRSPALVAPAAATLPPAVAAALPFPGGRVAPGRYETELLGIPIEFTIGQATALRTARPGTILLTPVGTGPSNLDGAPHVQIIRVAGWNTRDEAGDRRFRGVGSIAPDDIEAWVADNDVIVDHRSRTRVDGRDARVLHLRVDPASPLGEDVCSPASRPCFWFASVAAEIIPLAAIRLDYALYGPTTVRMWLITIEGGDPILVQAAAIAGDESWLDDFEATTMATFEVGG